MKFTKLFMVALLVFTLTFSVMGCSSEVEGEGKQREDTQIILNEVNNEIGMPNLVNFQQKKLLKQIYELCDKENLICYLYTKADLTGKFIFQGKCVGYGIPFSAQFTNPSQIVEGDKYFGYDLSGYLNYLEVMPQADPNGLYMPTSSSATWTMMIDYQGIPRVVYVEPEITVSPFPLPYAEYPKGFKPGIPLNYPGVDISNSGK